MMLGSLGILSAFCFSFEKFNSFMESFTNVCHPKFVCHSQMCVSLGAVLLFSVSLQF